jgi:hypothetical protein
MSGTYIPECEMCESVEHNGLQQICDNTEDMNVLCVCDKCYEKATKPTCCDRCEQSFPVNKYRLTFADETKTFTLCYDCHENYKHADAEEEDDDECREETAEFKMIREASQYENQPTNFCCFCELFYYDTEFMSDRCKKCHDRMWAELQAEYEENK